MKTKKDSIKNRVQKGTEYKPTAAQARLLEILLNPDHRLKSRTAICTLAPCARHVYYDAFKKPAFVSVETAVRHENVAMGIMSDEVAKILHGYDRAGDGVHICSESVVKHSKKHYFFWSILRDTFHRPCEQEYIDKNTGY